MRASHEPRRHFVLRRAVFSCRQAMYRARAHDVGMVCILRPRLTSLRGDRARIRRCCEIKKRKEKQIPPPPPRERNTSEAGSSFDRSASGSEPELSRRGHPPPPPAPPAVRAASRMAARATVLPPSRHPRGDLSPSHISPDSTRTSCRPRRSAAAARKRARQWLAGQRRWWWTRQHALCLLLVVVPLRRYIVSGEDDKGRGRERVRERARGEASRLASSTFYLYLSGSTAPGKVCSRGRCDI